MIRAGIFGINIVIETDDPSVKSLLEFTVSRDVFSPVIRRVIPTTVKGKIYNRKKTDQKTRHVFFEVGIGWLTYIMNIFGKYLYAEDYNRLMDGIVQKTYRDYPFKELYPEQNSDVLHLLKYKFGLYSVYTGYGKTSVIAALANYFGKELGKKVLLVTPNKKPQDELLKRLKDNYNIVVPKKFGGSDNIQSIIVQGFTNRSDVKDPAKWSILKKEFETFEVLLADEVEYCINPSGELIFSSACNVQNRYGFSGTADKVKGELINLHNGLEDETVSNNINLIKYFGPTLIYRKPLNKEVDLITIKTKSLNKVSMKDIDKNNLSLSVLTTLFTSPEVCNTIVNVCKNFPLLYIPINNLVHIIYHWIDNYFKGVLRVLLVCNEGYVYYDSQGNKSKHTLDEAKELIRKGEVDVIPSTSSGFRALDLPNLKNTLLIDGKIGGAVLQQVGRVARQYHMNIITLAPNNNKNIPIFTKGSKARTDLIKEHYKYCNITEVYVEEDDLAKYNGIK